MSVLERIFEERRRDVAEARQRVPLVELRAQLKDQEPPRGFLRALRNRSTRLALIAEIKPASPSQGAIDLSLDPAEVAQDYEAAGAHALSVLTEPRHFGGAPENIGRAKAVTALPALRKDFIDDPYQVYEARAWGADAILLIVAALSPQQLRELQTLAQELEMDVLVEVHDERELEIALDAEVELIGVNSRDLKSLQTDLGTAERLLPMIGEQAFAIAESALSTREDVLRMERAGAGGVLIGTAFCQAPDRQAAVRGLMGW